MSRIPVTLQITLAPSDWRHAQHLLAHQLSVWRGQVAEVLITVDFHRSKGRFSARWAEGEHKILPLAESFPGVRVVKIDYGADAQARAAAEFFGGRAVPAKDFRGGPYYSYFFSLSEARNDYVLHVDSDMFFGGGSQTWLAEAVDHMQAHSDVLFAAPLPGPPRADGTLLQLTGIPEPDTAHAYRFPEMSTRLFLLNRSRFKEKVGALRPHRPKAWKNTLIAWLEGNPAEDLPEHLFTEAMQRHGLARREFLGRAPGMWSLHPPYRGADFYAKVPELIRCVETGDVPDAQRGDHDINASLVDWSEGIAALKRNRIWRRVLRLP